MNHDFDPDFDSDSDRTGTHKDPISALDTGQPVGGRMNRETGLFRAPLKRKGEICETADWDHLFQAGRRGLGGI